MYFAVGRFEIPARAVDNFVMANGGVLVGMCGTALFNKEAAVHGLGMFLLVLILLGFHNLFSRLSKVNLPRAILLWLATIVTVVLAVISVVHQIVG